MTPYRTIAIPEKVADLVRATRLSPGYGHPAHAELAAGYGPCRLCLRTFAVGAERRILFTYDPFFGLEPLPLPGPIFIHEEACARHAEDGGFPADLRSHALTFAAYGSGRRLIVEERVGDGRIEPVVERLLAQPEVAYLHVRDTEAGCYDFRIERAAADPA
jgi:hypothetical protein